MRDMQKNAPVMAYFFFHRWQYRNNVGTNNEAVNDSDSIVALDVNADKKFICRNVFDAICK